jgi:hypothetical protein
MNRPSRAHRCLVGRGERASGRRFAASTVIIVVAVSMGLLPAGCGNETAPTRPPLATALLEGRIGAFEPGIDMDIEFARLDAPGITYRMPIDDAGWYRIELPVGDYRATLFGAFSYYTYAARGGGVTTVEAEAETLRLRAGDALRRRDFGTGAMHLVVDGLEALDGWRGYALLYKVPVDTVWAWSTGSSGAVVSDGVLELRTRPTPPGTYQLRFSFEMVARPGNHTEMFWCSSSGDPSVPDELRIGPDSLTTHEPTLPQPATLAGRVTGAWQELGGESPEVEAIDTAGVVVCSNRTLEADGSFRLVLPRPRPVRVAIGDDRDIWIGGTSAETATVFSPGAGAVIGGITQTVSGMLVRPTAEVPLSQSDQYRVELHDAQGLAPMRSFWASGGVRVSVGSLRPGTYHVRLVGDPTRSLWRPQWYDRAATVDLSLPVVIPDDGSVVVIDPVLERGGQISGTAAIGGTAYCFVLITGVDAAIVTAYTRVRADSPGFRWTGLAEGRYRIGLHWGETWPVSGGAPPAGTHWYPGVADWAAAAELEIVDAGVITDLELGPPPAR